MRVCPACRGRTEASRCPRDGCATEPVPHDGAAAPARSERPCVGPYVLGQRLGGGAHGVVYRARELREGTPVAVKLLEAGDDPRALRRFRLEARHTRRLRHPNTVRLLDVGQTDDDRLYLVMELVEGPTLADVLAAEGRLGPARAVRLLLQLLDSLREAHAAGIVHRDVKPSNLALPANAAGREQVKVLDFGLSRAVEASGAGTRGPVGTPRYMAPEQWRAEAVDGRADLYALGAVAYEMLAGQPPFPVPPGTPSPVLAQCRAHEREPPPPLHEVAPGASPEPLEALVMRLLAKQPDARASGADEVRTTLRRVADARALSERPTGSAPPSGLGVALSGAGSAGPTAPDRGETPNGRR